VAAQTALRSVRFNAIGLLGCVIVVAWLVCAWADRSGFSAGLHHHALYAGRPFWMSALVLVCA